MIHEGVRAYNTRDAALRQRTPHAQCSDELNHRTQAPPARPEGILDPFARITRVSAIAPNLVRVIRRLRPTDVGANSGHPRRRRRRATAPRSDEV